MAGKKGINNVPGMRHRRKGGKEASEGDGLDRTSPDTLASLADDWLARQLLAPHPRHAQMGAKNLPTVGARPRPDKTRIHHPPTPRILPAVAAPLPPEKRQAPRHHHPAQPPQHPQAALCSLDTARPHPRQSRRTTNCPKASAAGNSPPCSTSPTSATVPYWKPSTPRQPAAANWSTSTCRTPPHTSAKARSAKAASSRWPKTHFTDCKNTSMKPAPAFCWTTPSKPCF